jgi:hypothetical protein
MVRRCDVTETAAKLSLYLEAYQVPADFDLPAGERQAVELVRSRYTNYEKVLTLLPRCPDDCPFAVAAQDGATGFCFSNDFARRELAGEARRLAAGAYNAWLLRRKQGIGRRPAPAVEVS